MSAGVPNWQKLHEMGKLPKNQRGNVAGLAEVDAAEVRIKELEAENARLRGSTLAGDDPNAKFSIRCEFEGCEYRALGKSEAVMNNNLRLHERSHEQKEV